MAGLAAFEVFFLTVAIAPDQFTNDGGGRRVPQTPEAARVIGVIFSVFWAYMLARAFRHRPSRDSN